MLKTGMRVYVCSQDRIGIFPDRDNGDGSFEFYVMTNDDGSAASWSNPIGLAPIVASSQVELDKRVRERFPGKTFKRVYAFEYAVGRSDKPYDFGDPTETSIL